MSMFVNTHNISKSIWKLENPIDKCEITQEWDYTQIPKIKDIKVWEVIYYVPGSIGVYAAHRPYVEFYLIYHNLLGVHEEFYGITASDDCKKQLATYFVNIENNTAWSNLHSTN